MNQLRSGECTDEDYILLSSRVLGNNASVDTIPPGTPIIVPVNELRMKINSFFVKRHSHALHQDINTVVAKDRCKKNKLTAEENKELKKLPNSRTGSLPGRLPLFPGMLVYLTKNEETAVGLTNGTKGKIRQIIGSPSQPDCVIVEFYGVTLPQLTGLQKNYVPIFTKSCSFSLKNRMMSQAKTISQTQFPLEPCYAITAHKN